MKTMVVGVATVIYVGVTMDFVKEVNDHVGVRADKFYKTTLFGSDALLLGLNCLEPGQVQSPHKHAHQDKFTTWWRETAVSGWEKSA
jgi:hypothetical protein